MKLKITVHGVAYEVDVEVLDAKDEMTASSPLPSMAPGAAMTVSIFMASMTTRSWP
ncbi:MAG: acetyl-CoA carboxylase biotin carboxyl carrier protein subunit, partial [Krumholzibacteria bacterium]|nr:acetyl-CoA carboxylase biotin carboxyl carrier protein subunit [Candidatus Krumholzibacteria bacterium]